MTDPLVVSRDTDVSPLAASVYDAGRAAGWHEAIDRMHRRLRQVDGLTVELSTGTYIAVDDLRAMLKVLRRERP